MLQIFYSYQCIPVSLAGSLLLFISFLTLLFNYNHYLLYLWIDIIRVDSLRTTKRVQKVVNHENPDELNYIYNRRQVFWPEILKMCLAPVQKTETLIQLCLTKYLSYIYCNYFFALQDLWHTRHSFFFLIWTFYYFILNFENYTNC